MESDIISKLSNAQNVAEAEKIIEQYYPNWLVLSLDGYSKDYPHLQKNWEILSQKLNTQPRKIILVNEIAFEETPSTLNKICDFMTLNGYAVRRSTEFIACQKCEKAIPCIEIWTHLKQKNFPVPEKWNNHCTECSP